MQDRMMIGQWYPRPIQPVGTPNSAGQAGKKTEAGSKPFSAVLQDNMVRLSHHAEQRLRQRGIELGPEQMAKLHSAMEKAAAKGAKDTLMLFQNMALIVNVKNKMVVTAMDEASMKESVFTQIDSAVIIR